MLDLVIGGSFADGLKSAKPILTVHLDGFPLTPPSGVEFPPRPRTLTPIIALIGTLPGLPFPVLSNHDCFRVHPNYGNDLRRQYNPTLHEIAKSNFPGYTAGQIVSEEIVVAEYADSSNQILEANYALFRV